MGFLTDLVTTLRAELDAHPLDAAELRRRAEAQPPARDLASALIRGDGTLTVIAEVKRASPSAGAIAADADPVAQARAYATGGAAAISVLTEGHHFRGSLEDLRAVRAAVDLPLLRKDFLIDAAQVTEARAAGADSVLLITSYLTDPELGELVAVSRGLGMEPLVETHDDRDLERALATDARVIGVNARNLETLEVDLDRALERVGRLPHDRIGVLESGVGSPRDAVAAAAAGASAILVGEALMRAEDPGAAIGAFRAAAATVSAAARSEDRPTMEEDPR